ncbi:YgfZ/GcvT domain-containing protein [Litoribrevibacter albus]|uniref:tRNA-modifying protein YgfZ n=1 Tax=Litoribrevibacter albus TaxID=1473156 RepID=A0AA37S7N9_9GAMM|nr:hypothetical protein [Litoribrevibacter albus]GLQ29798.1 tRNA-modifying protein YgfZ [Litoribrevibacter albus]
MSTKIEQLLESFPATKLELDLDNAPKFVVETDTKPSAGITLCATKGILSITGEQRLKFLQGQTTCDTAVITPERASFGAFCNIKGRAIANFLAFDDGISTHLIMHQGLIQPLIAHLTKFAVFFRVTLEETLDQLVLGALNEQDDSDSSTQTALHTSKNDGNYRIQLTPQRTITITSIEDAKDSISGTQLLSESQWNIEDLKEGICWLSPSSSEEFLPQLLGLEEIEGLSFTKGCYTGQEIIARMKYRGQMKRHITLAGLASDDSQVNLQELKPGDKINTSEKNNIGQLINYEITPTGLLALISLEDDFKTIDKCSINQNSLEIKLMEINPS